MNSTATCPTWRGMSSDRSYLARNSSYDENKQPYHIGSVAAHGSKDLAFRRTPERRCQECYWCIIKDSWRRQHHHRHMEHKDAKSCKETQELTHKLNRYRWNILGLCERNNNRGRTRFSSVKKRINMSMALDFLFTRTS